MAITVNTKSSKAKATQKATDEIDILLPETQFDSSQGLVTLRPIKFGDFKRFSEVVASYRTLISEKSVDGELNLQTVITDLLIDDAEKTLSDVQVLLSLTSDISESAIQDLPFNEVVELAACALGANLNFFVQSLSAGTARLRSVGSPPALEKQSSPSVPTDLGGTPSEE
jgi:hypothetical protein